VINLLHDVIRFMMHLVIIYILTVWHVTVLGRDCIGCAKTGSGKTAAFALPILQKLCEDPYGIFALILSPTRCVAVLLWQKHTQRQYRDWRIDLYSSSWFELHYWQRLLLVFSLLIYIFVWIFLADLCYFSSIWLLISVCFHELTKLSQ